jgi:hypothetical protein
VEISVEATFSLDGALGRSRDCGGDAGPA